jgi:hypothetical protein
MMNERISIKKHKAATEINPKHISKKLFVRAINGLPN